MSYSIQQWLLFFYIYCFLGWCFESSYVSIRKRRFVNRGFLHSPMLPIYGSGAVVMLLVTLKLREHLVLMFLAGMVGATLLELVVGLAMEAIFKVKYWDYSNQKFSYKGVICLSSSLCWGLFTVLLNQYIHRPVEEFVLGLSWITVLVAVVVISVIFVCDTVVSVKVALGIRDMLDARVRFKKEVGELAEQFSERLGNLWENLAESFGDRLMEFGKSSAGERLNALVDAVNERLNALTGTPGEGEQEDIRALSGLKERLKSLKRENESQTERMAYLKLKMFRRNPTATSGKFKEEFSQVREEQVKWYERRRQEKQKKKEK
ncbi:MAG: putative ABC transporter permease [Lachnospiraceae bacterium]|nr:putative ABC transporter permease [Lachnospiraceae bacterium]